MGGLGLHAVYDRKPHGEMKSHAGGQTRRLSAIIRDPSSSGLHLQGGPAKSEYLHSGGGGIV